MPLSDSFDKIVRYIEGVTNEPFTYKKKSYEPQALRVSVDVIRDYTCPSHCGGCCQKFSLDYLPSENNFPPDVAERIVEFDGREIKIVSDTQPENNGHKCRHLRQDDGRCGIYTARPFSCDFELTRFLITKSPHQPNRVNTQLFGRGWAMRRIDGDRGAMCTIIPATEESKADVILKFRRFEEWCHHINIKTKIPVIISWIETLEIKKLNSYDPLMIRADGSIRDSLKI